MWAGSTTTAAEAPTEYPYEEVDHGARSQTEDEMHSEAAEDASVFPLLIMVCVLIFCMLCVLSVCLYKLLKTRAASQALAGQLHNAAVARNARALAVQQQP